MAVHLVESELHPLDETVSDGVLKPTAKLVKIISCPRKFHSLHELKSDS